MKIQIDFSEIQSLVKSKTGRELVLSAMNERTVKAETKVSMKVPLLGEIEKAIGLNVSVERIEDNDVHLKYDGGMGTDMIVGGLLTFLSSSSARNMVEKAQGNGIVVHLNEIEEARKVLDMVELTDISFQNESAVIEGKLRNN